MELRNVHEEDYAPIISVVDDWWGDRHIADMLPKLFFQRLLDTSFFIKGNERIKRYLTRHLLNENTDGDSLPQSDANIDRGFGIEEIPVLITVAIDYVLLTGWGRR